ncbi:6-carboxytetrahydropterin synthase [Flavobacteriales bacterium]|nr:6-carboxytetrahydropterin synthase [Flavobacteriales bacterium]
MLYLTRRERFCAAHKLWIEDWSEEKNYQTFGKCSNPNWHGHNYELFVTVKGIPDPVTGFVADLSAIGRIVKQEAIVHLDHKNLNLDTPFLKGKMTTTEIIAIEIWRVLEDKIKEIGADLHCIKVQETENNSVEYYG